MGMSVSTPNTLYAFYFQIHKSKSLMVKLTFPKFLFFNLEAHPEIKKLMIVDHRFKYHVILLVILQLLVIPIIPHLSWTTFFLVTYFYGAVINHAILDAIHEISHNMAYGNSKPLHNRIFGMFANLPTTIPVSVTFKRYHQDHHRFQGDEELDPDLPTEWEGQFFRNSFTKAIYCRFNSFFLQSSTSVCESKESYHTRGFELYNSIVF